MPALRVRGPYLAMVTIAFGFVVEQGAAEWSELTGGWNGLIGHPAPSLLGADVRERGIAIARRSVLTLWSLLALRPPEREPVGQGHARRARLGDRQPVDRPRPDR